MRSALLRDRNSRETRLHVAFHIPSIKSADVNALDIAADILGARDNSRLVRILKKEKGVVNDISAYAVTPRDPGLMVISARLDAKDLEAATKGIMDELAKLIKEKPSEAELIDAKIHIESQHLYARETVQGMARSIGNFQADLGDAYYEEKYLKLNAAVTPDQVSSVISKYFTPANVTIAVLMPETGNEDFTIDKLTKIVTSFEATRKTAVTVSTAESKTIVRNLPNGIKVVLSPDDSNPVVSIRIALLGGKRFESKETEGIMNFIAQMLNKGTSKMSEVEIARKVDEMGGRLAGFSGYDSFGFYGTFFSRYLDEALKLMAELYRDPAFPTDKFERERALIINKIRTEPDRPVSYAINVLNGTLFPHHPYGFVKEGTITSVFWIYSS